MSLDNSLGNSSTQTPIKNNSKRSVKLAMFRGFLCKCPSCGKGSVFDGLLKVSSACKICNEDLSHEKADDFPAYLNVLIVGHIIVGFAMTMMKYKYFDVWTITFLTAFICIVVSLLLMRPLKGLVVGSQWALGMHGFENKQAEQPGLESWLGTCINCGSFD